jgi:hypothetical protein
MKLIIKFMIETKLNKTAIREGISKWKQNGLKVGEMRCR